MVLRCGGWGDCGVRSLELSLVDSSKVHVLLPPNLLYLLLRQIIGKGIIILINGVCLVILTWPGFCASPVHFRQTLAIVAEPCDGMRPGSGAQGSGLSSGSPVPATGLGIERGLPPPPVQLSPPPAGSEPAVNSTHPFRAVHWVGCVLFCQIVLGDVGGQPYQCYFCTPHE